MKFIKNIILVSIIWASGQILVSGKQLDKLSFDEGPVVLTGQIRNATDDKVMLLVQEICGPVRHVATLDEEGRFRFSIDVLSAHDNRLRFGKKSITLFLAPSDTVHIEADEANFLATVSYSGDHAKFNQCLLLFITEFGDALKKVGYHEKKRNMSPVDFVAFDAEFSRSLRERAAAIAKNVNPEKEAIAWMDTFIEYQTVENLLEYGQMHKNEIASDFYGFLDNIRSSNGYEMQCSQYYDDYIEKFHFGYKLSQVDGFRKTMRLLKEGTHEGLSSFFDFVHANVTDDVVEDIFLTQFCIRFIESDPDLISSLFDKYSKLVEDVTCQNYVLRRIEEVKSEPALVQNLSDLAGLEHVGEIFKEIKRDHTGKVLYVDVWGTWCGNCIIHAPHSNELRESLKGEDIEFVYLCIKSPKEDWKRMVKRLNLKGTQYYLTNAQSKSLQDNLKAYSVPRYIVIGKDGMIVDANAKRPYSKALKGELRALSKF